MAGALSILISSAALVLSIITAWVTLFRRGTIKMTQPTQMYFGPDGPNGLPKVHLRTLLYSTSKRGQVIENMFVKVKRAESSQTFNIWVYGAPLLRGSGLYVGESGVAFNHHFLLPRDATDFTFTAGDYVVEVFALLVGNRVPHMLHQIFLQLGAEQATEMRKADRGIFYDWGPDSGKYHGSVDDRKRPSPFEVILDSKDSKL